jgi:hypothetical protein
MYDSIIGYRYHSAWPAIMPEQYCTCALAHGTVAIYWNSCPARSMNREFRDRGAWQATSSEQRCANAKKEREEKKCENIHASAFCAPVTISWIEDGRDSDRARSDVPFTYPARILSSILPSRAHLLRFHADRFALTRIPFSADGVLHHANVHLLQHVRPLI